MRSSDARSDGSASIELRPARPDDAEAISDYHQRCFANTFADLLAAGAVEPPSRSGTLAQFRDWFQRGSAFVTVVAVADGDTPVGHVTVRGHHLVHLFVEPALHGRGLGRRLLAEGEAMLSGHPEFELHARVENTRALAFYRAAGWVQTERRITTVDHGVRYDEWVLTKRPS